MFRLCLITIIKILLILLIIYLHLFLFPLQFCASPPAPPSGPPDAARGPNCENHCIKRFPAPYVFVSNLNSNLQLSPKPGTISNIVNVTL